MPTVLQVYFPFNGPFGDEMEKMMATLAHSINEEPGLIWKIWTEDEESNQAGGVYLFQTRENAIAYREKHTARLKDMGVSEIEAQILTVNQALSSINNGPLR
ncbi:monooxygenase [Halomonas sp. GFAJ-1]|uniref:monooxygenase n=1 Tax=Halomonas sp. GFAJ-1 TaxID=1118153 RepID=UPI00023A29BD|nr:monooxygenase [Halomonas sp. GFAJ-1]AVI62109.1 monooxygenase [Halomonas sp. GFAJ-1]EHK61300.1 putative monooxygenase [Halomonas sp. GFAJ-1]